MDLLSHALWSNLIYSKAETPDQMLAVGLGVLPDLIPFAPMTVQRFVRKIVRHRSESHHAIPGWVYRLYDFTHSIPVWTVWFGIWWAIAGHVPWPAFAWLIHIAVDIPTHTKQFFPTPFLWPISDFKVNGFSWAERWFMRLNYGSLVVAYLLAYVVL